MFDYTFTNFTNFSESSKVKSIKKIFLKNIFVCTYV